MIRGIHMIKRQRRLMMQAFIEVRQHRFLPLFLLLGEAGHAPGSTIIQFVYAVLPRGSICHIRPYNALVFFVWRGNADQSQSNLKSNNEPRNAAEIPLPSLSITYHQLDIACKIMCKHTTYVQRQFRLYLCTVVTLLFQN